MNTDKYIWEHIRPILEHYGKKTDESHKEKTLYVLKAFIFGIAYVAEHEDIPPGQIAVLLDEVRNEVRLLTDKSPIIMGQTAEA